MGVKGRENGGEEEKRRRGSKGNKRVGRGAIEIMIRRLLGISVYVRIKNLRKIE